MPTSVACQSCGAKLKVADELIATGQLVKCPRCGSALPSIMHASQSTPAPAFAGPPALPPPATTSPLETSPSILREPVRLALVLGSISMGLAWLTVSLLIHLANARPFNAPVAMIVLSLVIICGLCGRSAWELFIAKNRAIRIHGQGGTVPLFFGLAQLITWEQNEGLILLKDKRIKELIYGPVDGGGIRIIYPVLGEELKEHLPLTLTLSHFHDKNIQTREAIQLTVKVAVWWKVLDMKKYYFDLSTGVHALRDTGQHVGGYERTFRGEQSGRKETAEAWILALAESSLRQLVSQTSAALVVSKRALVPLPSSPVGTTGALTPDVIAREIQDRLQPKARRFGLEIDHVEVQQVELPEHIQKAVDDVWIASTTPIKTEHEARALEDPARTARCCHRQGCGCRQRGHEEFSRCRCLRERTGDAASRVCQARTFVVAWLTSSFPAAFGN